jgi:hypothetical protein
MRRVLAAAGVCLVFLAGCVDPQKRAQIEADNERERDLNIRLVGEVASFGNLGGLRVDGVGLVTGLAGTGHCPEGFYRDLLEQYLLKTRGAANGALPHIPKGASVRQILDNPNNCLVIVTCYIPAGARRGDRFDVEVTLPEGSKATSLIGGYLHPAMLRVWEAVSKISNNPENQRSSRLLEGHVFAIAQGRLIVGFGGTSDAHELREGRIWQGGTSRIARPYQLALRTDDKSAAIAESVAKRINFMFEDDPRAKTLHADFSAEENQILLLGNVAHQLNDRHDPSGMNPNEVAKAMNKEFINVRVPLAYRFNHLRFIMVSGMTPLNHRDPALQRYTQRCQKMLQDPRFTTAAAMRLEALGRDVGVPILKTGLDSDHPFVRFASAEALAYLGSTAGVEVLAQCAQKHTIFAKHATLALASLEESISHDKLSELFASDDPALRCSAFHALSLVEDTDPRHKIDPRLGGQLLNNTFWLHRLPQSPCKTVYYSTSKRAQVVLFGRDIVLDSGTRMIVGDYTVAPNDKPHQFLVKRFTSNREQPRPRVCSDILEDVLIALADQGATYPDVVQFLRQAHERGHVNCQVMNWTTPEVTLRDLIEAGQQMKSGQ